jgi:hypothetical protein
LATFIAVRRDLRRQERIWLGRKLRVMEELWESLSRQEARLETPPWHEEALRETAARHDAGREQPIDWDAAKRASAPGEDPADDGSTR